jgi:hypothetical protein
MKNLALDAVLTIGSELNILHKEASSRLAVGVIRIRS